MEEDTKKCVETQEKQKRRARVIDIVSLKQAFVWDCDIERTHKQLDSVTLTGRKKFRITSAEALRKTVRK